MTESKTNLIQSLIKVMADVGYLEQAGKNDFHNYKYVKEAQVSEALRVSFIKNGIMLIPSCKSTRTEQDGVVFIEMEFEIFHTSGQSIKVSWAGSGQDISKSGKHGDKGLYKAYTGAIKYILMKMFLIPTGDDPEADSKQDKANAEQEKPKPLTKKEEKELEDMVDYIGNLAGSPKVTDPNMIVALEDINKRLDDPNENVTPAQIRAFHKRAKEKMEEGK